MSGERPDDRCGTGFRETLVELRARHARRGATGYGSLPVCRWIPGRHKRSDGPERSATADCGDAHLLVVEMGDVRLAQAPMFVPRVSWCMWADGNRSEPMSGGPAPSFEDAKLRAELALRAHLGVSRDS